MWAAILCGGAVLRMLAVYSEWLQVYGLRVDAAQNFCRGNCGDMVTLLAGTTCDDEWSFGWVFLRLFLFNSSQFAFFKAVLSLTRRIG